MVSNILEDIVTLTKRKTKELYLFLIFTFGIAVLILGNASASMLESWQSCCGAVCLRTVAGLLGNKTELSEVRELLQPNSTGETSLAEIAETAQKMGFYSIGLRIKSEKLQRCSMPLIAHKEPQHFIVILGLGKEKGVMVIDPPYKPQKVTVEELVKQQEHWNVVAISKHPIGTKNQRIGKLQDQASFKEQASNEYGGLRFDSSIWNFGSVKPDVEKTYEFSFKNISKKPVALSKVKANCACLKVVNFTEKVAPGKKGVIKVLLDTKGLQGNVVKKIIGIINNVNTDKNEQLLLTVFGEVSRRGELLLRPSEIHLPDLVKGSKVSKSLTLRRIGYDKLFLKEIKLSSPSVSVRIIDGFEDNSYEAHIDIQIETQGKLGAFEHTVLFKTDFQDHPIANLRIYGNIVPHISVEPSEAFLGLISHENLQEKSITIRSITNKQFTIKEVELFTDDIVAQCQPIKHDKTVWQLKLIPSAALKKGILKGKVLLKTNDPDLPKIQIPYTGLVAG